MGNIGNKKEKINSSLKRFKRQFKEQGEIIRNQMRKDANEQLSQQDYEINMGLAQQSRNAGDKDYTSALAFCKKLPKESGFDETREERMNDPLKLFYTDAMIHYIQAGAYNKASELLNDLGKKGYSEKQLSPLKQKLQQAKEGGLEKTTKTIAIFSGASFILSIFFLSSNITGNAISNLSQTTSNYIGGILFVLALVGAFFLFRNRRTCKPEKTKKKIKKKK